MARILLLGLLLIGIGVITGLVVGSRGASTVPADVQRNHGEPASVAVRPNFGTHAVQADGEGHSDQLERRVDALTAQVAAGAAERHSLQKRIEALATQLAALRGGAPETAHAPASTVPTGAVTPAATGDASPNQTPGAAADGISAMERALAAAGVDPATVADIKHRQDGLALEEIYLRDQATREGWLDAPRFSDEMAKIDSQRVPIRDQIGDDAYDAYLAALGQPNRVQVEDVMQDSPAALAGLQNGDVVLRYGDTRVFAAGDLVTATHAGQLGDSVQLQIMRDGQPLEIAVPRGPLGISIGGMADPAPATH